ncbi:hypothetical protein [Iningainema tapete]|uniref:Uncharacterized protein n=1 Tax=Iningainema tapete BLCC-T55 TaxID=2748662 RepID=A0A8J6XQF2_9CYAN|nr:hypothetical protein [Iningainema tapete]MBD2776329.1 hypothetical protein [Iningainema tapete BLCC-T55]
MVINNVAFKGVVVEQDLNTLAEEIEQRRFKNEEIKSYFQSAAVEAEANINVIFP